MFDFPSSAKLERTIPKSAFSTRYGTSGSATVKFPPGLKDQFRTLVDQIVLEYDFQECSTMLQAVNIREIMVMTINFKQKPKDEKLVEFLLRNNPHKILCVVQSPDADDVVALMAEGSFYAVPYQGQTFHISGRTLDQAWESLVEQAVLFDEPASNEPLARRLQKRSQRLKWIAEIDKLEKRKNKEVQPAKKIDLHHQILSLREKLRRLTEPTTDNSQENNR